MRHIAALFIAQNSPTHEEASFVTVLTLVSNYLADDSGAMSVDWTVLSAGAVSVAIATTAIMTDTIDNLSMRMDAELRARQLGDEWVQFYANHFEPILAVGAISETQAETAYSEVEELMNHDVVTNLAAGITAMEEGTITEQELVTLVALASVAYQRNIVDDGILDHYFGFGGSTPYYMTLANAPTLTN